jgi:hypothetical protein
VPSDEIGAERVLEVGTRSHGVWGAVKRRRIRVRVYADATTSPTKVIHVTVAPPGSEQLSTGPAAAAPGEGNGSSGGDGAGEAVDFLLDAVKTTRYMPLREGEGR